jgi:hypothetical protein
MTFKEFLDWCSNNGMGIALFMLFVGIPVIAMIIGFFKWVFKTAVQRTPCPQCGWPNKVLNPAPGAPQNPS